MFQNVAYGPTVCTTRENRQSTQFLSISSLLCTVQRFLPIIGNIE